MLQDLKIFVDQEGPFDDVMSFAQGTGIPAALMIRQP